MFDKVTKCRFAKQESTVNIRSKAATSVSITPPPPPIPGGNDTLSSLQESLIGLTDWLLWSSPSTSAAIHRSSQFHKFKFFRRILRSILGFFTEIRGNLIHNKYCLNILTQILRRHTTVGPPTFWAKLFYYNCRLFTHERPPIILILQHSLSLKLIHRTHWV